MRSWILTVLAAFLLVGVCQLQAHHSFAIYDIDTKIQRALIGSDCAQWPLSERRPDA